ncbi:MAG: cell division ATP-binding protein FtsE [Oscillospiraceae bacterium]|nr:cell division ATP-binding protein FtsE [Oscillospiraceae bacterium]
MIQFKNVTQRYPNGTKALKNVNLNIEKGEFVFIVGASGAGKSTLVKLLMREEKICGGELRVNGFDLKRMSSFRVPILRRTVGVVFQDYRLLPKLTAYENIAFAMHMIGEPKSEIDKRVKAFLRLVNLDDKANSFPHELSGGEQQRVALARAVINKPAIILADEPTGNIDPMMSVEMMELLCKFNKWGTTVVVVTHDKNLVDYYSKRVVTINNGKITSDKQGGMFDED